VLFRNFTLQLKDHRQRSRSAHWET